MILIILAYIFSSLSFLMSTFIFLKLKSPRGWFYVIPKTIALALSPYWVILGSVGAMLSVVYQALEGVYYAIGAIPIGVFSAIIMIWFVRGCTREHKSFENAFGVDWIDKIPPEITKLMLRRRWSLFLRLKKSPKPSWERDVPFWTIPGTDRQLLCDIWSPSDGKGSGLAYIYYHGSGWGSLDKDYFTRPIFRHLVAQGHTVMDVAYRLVPEVDIYGMIGDVKRAIAWMKENADRYSVDREKIVLGGSSAGGHLALLAGYTPENPDLTPEDLKDVDLSVCGIVSLYGSTDLVLGYKRYGLPPDLDLVPIGTIIEDKGLNFAGRVDILLGGRPDQVPEMYELACPTTHVKSNSPPTLLIQGDIDFIVPIEGTLDLYAKLVESGVPAINVIFPRVDHIFDLIIPQVSPPAQSALYEIDRFLAFMASKDL
ncbi:MAG: alpha/beta hydrolase fold domain-containing protein [Candidatus Thorarchaeota archaeon]